MRGVVLRGEVLGGKVWLWSGEGDDIVAWWCDGVREAEVEMLWGLRLSWESVFGSGVKLYLVS